MNKQEFIAKLQEEAAFQAQLAEHRLLPKKIDMLTAFIGTHPWQTLVLLSIMTAVFLEVLEKM
jgi:hypothetical protein